MHMMLKYINITYPELYTLLEYLEVPRGVAVAYAPTLSEEEPTLKRAQKAFVEFINEGYNREPDTPNVPALILSRMTQIDLLGAATAIGLLVTALELKRKEGAKGYEIPQPRHKV